MFLIDIKLYRSEIELYIGKTHNNIYKITKRHGKKHYKFLSSFSDGFCFACCLNNKNEKVFIVSMDKKAKSEEVFHESLHLSYYILDNAGVKYDVDNHEAIAYLQGYIARKIKRQIRKI